LLRGETMTSQGSHGLPSSDISAGYIELMLRTSTNSRALVHVCGTIEFISGILVVIKDDRRALDSGARILRTRREAA
jgi:hypothetical protein